jgi:hypothetical protein
MAWLICPEDDRLIEVNGGDPNEALTDMANHVADVHCDGDQNAVELMLTQIEEIR